MNYQDFSTASNPKLSALDSKINIDTKDASFTSISGNVRARAEFLQYGYYKVANQFVYNILIDESSPPKQVMPNYNSDLTVFFLNTNACYNRNVALMKEENDVANQLSYLETQLKTLEQTSKYAWIVGHINPGSKHCNPKWARRYNVLVERFQKTIRMQLFGQEAEEYFQLQYPVNGPRKPIGVTIQGSRATSYAQNPRFKIIEIDKQFLMPQRVTVYEFDFDKANSDYTAQPLDLIKKVKEYPKDYGMSTLRPVDFEAYVSRIKSSEEEAVKFLQMSCPTSDPDDGCVKQTCDTECRLQLTCKLSNASAIDIIDCRENNLLDREFSLDYLISQLQNPWV